MFSPSQPGYGTANWHPAGRRNLQNPGGNSSINLSDGSNYSPYAPRAQASPAVAGNPYSSAAYGSPSSAAYGSPSYGATPQVPASDYNSLAPQLNLPQNMRRPPSSGRRAHAPMPSAQQPSYQPPSPYGQPSYSPSSGGGSILGNNSGYQSQNPYAYPSGSPTYGGAGPNPHAQQGFAPKMGYASAQQGMTPAPAYGSSASPYGGSANAYGGGYAGGMGSSPSVPRPAQSQGPAPFVPGQKGAFCGKVSMQPPGGRQTLNIFGGY